MKLHLPRALRGALLATFALSLTTPVWAYDSNPEYNGKYIYLFDSADAIDTAKSTPEEGKVYVRPADNATDPIEPGQKATIGSVTLNNNLTMVIQTNEWQTQPSFTNLTFNNVTVADNGNATINVTANNVLSVGAVDGNVRFSIDESGTLSLNFNDFAGTLQTDSRGNVDYTYDSQNQPTLCYEGGLAGSISGAGTLALTGEVVWNFGNLNDILVDNDTMGGVVWSPESYSTTLDFSAFTGTIDTSNLKLVLPDGYTGGFTYGRDDKKLRVMLLPAPTQRYSLDSTETPTASYTSNAFESTEIGNLSATTNATKSWTLTLRGSITNPEGGFNKDIVLVSTNPVTGDSAKQDYGSTGFALYMTPTGELVLHRAGELADGSNTWTSNSNADYSSTYILQGLATDWTTCDYTIVLNYSHQGNQDVLLIDRNNSSLRFGETVITLTNTYNGVSLGGIPAASALNNLYTRLPGSSELNATVSGEATKGSYWLINSNVSTEELLAGKLTDQASGESVAMVSSDALRFNGGALRSGTDGSSFVYLENSIEAVDGAKVYLMPESGTWLVLADGEGALNANKGLQIEGGAGSTVVLGGVATSTPENISLAAANTLSFTGADVTIDAAKNTLDPTANLRREDGGTLVYVGTADTSIGSLAAEWGTVEMRGTTQVNNGVVAETVSVLEDGTVATVSGSRVNANTVNLGNPFGSAARNVTLKTDEVRAVTALNMGNGATLSGLDTADGSPSAIEVHVGGLMVATGATLDVGVGSLEADGKNIFIGGDVKSDAINLSGVGQAYASGSNIFLTADTLVADSLMDADITVDAPSSDTTPVLQLGEAKWSAITTNTDTLITHSVLNGSAVNAAAGTLTLANTTVNGTSSVTSTNAITLDTVTMLAKSSLTVGGTTYTTASTAGESGIILTGTASSSAMTLTKLVIDTSDELAPNDGTIYLTTTNGSFDIEKCAITLYTAPGIVGSITVDPVTGDLVFSSAERSSDVYDSVATSTNSQAAKDALIAGAAAAPGTELEALYNYVIDSSHVDSGARQQALEALTSGSLTMLADSQRRGVTNTISALRNRIIQMGHAEGIETETAWHAWIEADGAYNDISGDDAAGYEFTTWGGTVGVHADVGNFSFGAAVSAAYGELKADTVDNAEGNNDTITISAFARHQSKNWVQMGVLSFGMNEMDMERSVHEYSATADTEGHTITAYYEAGYAIALGESGRQVIQPLVSLTLTSATLEGFSESGSIGNAGLVMEDEDYFYGSLGIGARYQAVLSQDVNERISFLELRARFVQDFGDDTHEASVRFVGTPGHSFMLQGTEVGSFGFQFGAGISVPLGQQTTFFADVDADIRDNATSVSGGMGVRVAF